MDWAAIGIIGGLLVAVATAFGYLVRARTDYKAGTAADHDVAREDVKQLIDLKDEMIAALRDQNDDLRKREAAMAADIADLKRRLAKVEGEYQTLLRQAVELGICAMAPHCANYVPPDRREGKVG